MSRDELDIPHHVREAVAERDRGYCRVCGRFVGPQGALHHIMFGGTDRGIGGRRIHNPDEIITICWMWAGNCHDRVHRDKLRWQPLLLEVLTRPGLTAMQLLRWRARHAQALMRSPQGNPHHGS